MLLVYKTEYADSRNVNYVNAENHLKIYLNFTGSYLESQKIYMC